MKQSRNTTREINLEDYGIYWDRRHGWIYKRKSEVALRQAYPKVIAYVYITEHNYYGIFIGGGKLGEVLKVNQLSEAYLNILRFAIDKSTDEDLQYITHGLAKKAAKELIIECIGMSKKVTILDRISTLFRNILMFIFIPEKSPWR